MKIVIIIIIKIIIIIIIMVMIMAGKMFALKASRPQWCIDFTHSYRLGHRCKRSHIYVYTFKKQMTRNQSNNNNGNNGGIPEPGPIRKFLPRTVSTTDPEPPSVGHPLVSIGLATGTFTAQPVTDVT